MVKSNYRIYIRSVDLHTFLWYIYVIVYRTIEVEGPAQNMEFYVNKDIKNTGRVFPIQGRYGYHRYDMNENPDGLPEDFVKEVLSEITPEFLSVYPEPDRFLNRYAEFIGFHYDNVLAANGSDMAIRYILETFGEKGAEVVTVSPSFEMYWVNCSILGLRHVPVPYEEDMTITADKICASISDKTRIVVLLNPNNPVGNVYTEAEAEQIIDKAEAVGAIVIIDEAYHYFYEQTFLSFVRSKKNVLILRTFSKLFSIAACRLGVIISTPQIIQYIKNAKLTFDVNAIALLFGERLLERPELIDSLSKTQKEGKTYLLSELARRDYDCRDCRGNFIFIRTKREAHQVTDELKQLKKVLVHDYGSELLKPYIRVSIGSKKAMEFFLQAFLEIDGY